MYATGTMGEAFLAMSITGLFLVIAWTRGFFTTGHAMEEMEKVMIEKMLSDTGGNRKETARRLGIGERTLYRKLGKYRLN